MALPAIAALGVAASSIAAAAQPTQTGQLATSPARSESRAHRVLLLRMAGSGNLPLAARAERAVAGALAELGFQVTNSPLPFHDAQLVAGCTGAVPECGAQVAQALESEHLAVAQLEDDPAASSARLELYVFESGGALRHGSAQLPRTPDQPLAPSVSALAARVFAVSQEPFAAAHDTSAEPRSRSAEPLSPSRSAEPLSRSPPEHSRDERRPQILRAVGWTSAGAGGALLVGALATSIAAQRAGQAYADSEVRSRHEADRALADYESAQRRADAARVLWGTGAGVLAAGAFMLLWERFAQPADRNLRQSRSGGRTGVRMTAMPASAGVSLTLSGEL